MKIIVYGFAGSMNSIWSIFNLHQSNRRTMAVEETQNFLAGQLQMRYGPNGIPGSPRLSANARRHSSIGYDPRISTEFLNEEPPAALSILPTEILEKNVTDNDGTIIIYHEAYLTTFGNILDFVVVIAFWIDFILIQFSYPWCSFFKGIAAMRCLKLLFLTNGTSVSINLVIYHTLTVS